MTQHIWAPTDSDMANAANWLDGTVPATAATNTLTLTGNALNNETVTLDAKVYTFQTTLTDVDGHVKIGSDPEESLQNLAAAITLGPGAGTKYAASTTLHPTVTAASVPATYNMTCTAKKTGTDGNSIASTETMVSGSFIGGATLSGATEWASTDEIVVPNTATVGMLTNVDWYTNTSPVLRIARMNVDGVLIPFTKNIGSTANPLRLELDKINYLGIGELHIDNMLDGLSPTDTPMYVIDSTSALTCAYLDGIVGALWVKRGYTKILSGCTFASSNASELVATLSPSAQLDIEGLDENGPLIMLPINGLVNNARRGSAGTVTIVVLGSQGTLYQTGKWNVQTIFVINAGGKLQYAPENDPGAFGPYMELLTGRSEFADALFDIATVSPVIGPYCDLVEGAMNPLAAGMIDLRKDFPL